MDASRFDALTKTFGTTDTRRALLRLLAGLPLGLTLAALLDDGPEATAQDDDHGSSHRHHRRVARHRHDPGKDKKKRKGKRKRKRKGQTPPAGPAPQPGCVPESKAQTCNGRCATVINNCGAAVACGDCNCDPVCGECFTCDPTSGNCIVDDTQLGDACGDPGQICQADGTCACSGDSCGVCRTCQTSGTCTPVPNNTVACDGSALRNIGGTSFYCTTDGRETGVCADGACFCGGAVYDPDSNVCRCPSPNTCTLSNRCCRVTQICYPGGLAGISCPFCP